MTTLPGFRVGRIEETLLYGPLNARKPPGLDST